MAREGSLLEAIYAAPERDELRLVYADWLQEQQDPRGELIQLQVAQARLVRRSGAYNRLQRRFDELWATGWAAWTPKVRLSDPSWFCEWTFHRGFATAVHTVASAFVESMDEFFAAAPLLEDVQLDCGRLGALAMSPVEWIDRLLASPLFRRVKTLRLQSLNDTGAVALCGQPGMHTLQGLELARTNLGLATYEVLGSRHSQLLKLQSLELMMANARDLAIEHLTQHRWPKLQSLMIGNEVVGERGMRALCDRGQLPVLKQLDLSWSMSGGTEAIAALAASQSLPALEELDLSHCDVTDGMCRALAEAKGFRLAVLRLAHADATASGIDALLGASVMQRVRLLDLTGNKLAPAERASLVERLGDRVLV